MKTVFKLISLLLVVSLALLNNATPSQSEVADLEQFLEQYKAYFKPLPKSVPNPGNPVTPEKVALGKRLFMETALSANNNISCNTCHSLTGYGVDNKPVSEGHGGQKGSRNAPTVYNSALHIAQFWDGRAKDVEEQALGPILNPVEMALKDEKEAEKRIRDKVASLPDYAEQFRAAFPSEADPISFENIGKAIGAFERTLYTSDRFDKFLNGDHNALTAEEKKGLVTFVDSGCVACHQGAALGGTMYQKLGIVEPFETDDLGRYQLTNKDIDKYVFKVPALRNIEKTAPYLHDGSIESLHQVVGIMGKHQLGRNLDKKSTEEIVTFLGALTGALPGSGS